MNHRTKLKTLGIILIIFLHAQAGAREAGENYPIRPVSFTNVHLSDEFFNPRLETNRKVSIPHAFRHLRKDGIIHNFRVAAGLEDGTYKGARQYHDSELFKVIQGAANTLRLKQDPALEEHLAKLAKIIAEAQEDDGYLYTWRTIEPDKLPKGSCGKTRWSGLSSSHELYNMGHFYEAAIAYYRATGDKTLLNAAVKNAELIDRVFGPDKRRDPPGHQEIEIGLCKLYRTTGDEKYLKLAKFFLEQRGRKKSGPKLYGKYCQNHKPVLQQKKAVGHAVRAQYMYSAMADIAALTDDQQYVKTLDKIWKDVIYTKTAVTGSVGAERKGESFAKSYVLPNKTAYNETCAAIANAMWNHRLFLLHGHAKYIDVLERVLYNAILSGVSLDGKKFFYCNPLSSDGEYKFNKGWATRFPWSKNMCCPTNLIRFLPTVPEYVYARKHDDIYVNLFIEGTGKIHLPDNTVTIVQKTDYPWSGDIRISVEPDRPDEFAILLRMPGWAQNQPVPGNLYRFAHTYRKKPELKVNGNPIKPDMQKGFAKIHRKWKPGDTIEISIPMPVRKVLCNQKVKANRGKLALQRGPIVYCIEWFDNGGDVSDIKVPKNESFRVTHMSQALGGISLLKAEKTGFLAIPYCTWSNRAAGEMTVWIPVKKDKEKSIPKPRKPEHGITVTEPAGTWKQALPAGNGSVGAMAYGQPERETILLNHQALFYPLWPKPEKIPFMARYLPELRSKIAQGKYHEAAGFWNKMLEKHKYGLQYQPFTNPYHPAFDLELSPPPARSKREKTFTQYKQFLNFQTGEITAYWKKGDTQFIRRLFVSRKDNAFILSLEASKPASISTRLALSPHPPGGDIYPVRMGRGKDYLLANKPYKDNPVTYENAADENRMWITGTYWNERKFGGIAKVVTTGGTITASDNKLHIKKADKILVIIKLFANTKNAKKTLKHLRSDINKLPQDYEKLFQPHAEKHLEIFNRMSLDLNAERKNASNAELLELAEKGNITKALVQRLFEFGRYIIICSSAPDSMPANLQGLWSGTWRPSWSCDYTVNENVQMAYWQALPGNMPEISRPYFDYFDSLIPDWKKNAKQFWNCRGMASFLRHSDHGLIIQYAPWQFWTAGAGWLGQLYYDYYLFTGDEKFLKKRALPYLKQAALFYEDFLCEAPDGKYIFSPSMSPENEPLNTGSKTTFNATMDIAVAKEVLKNLISGCRILGIEKNNITRWKKMLQKMPEYMFEDDGTIKEWITPDLKNNDRHRHMSQIYPLFPGFEVDADHGDPRLRKGCRIALEKKYKGNGYGFGWSFAHMANAFARLGYEQKTLESLRRVARTCSDKNLLSFYEPPEGPFQIDGNCGFSSAVLEMILQSRPGVIKLLPALPKTWTKGSAKNMLARGAVTVGIEWDIPAGKIKATLSSRQKQSVTLSFPEPVSKLTAEPGQAIEISDSERGPEYRIIKLPAEKKVTLLAKL